MIMHRAAVLSAPTRLTMVHEHLGRSPIWIVCKGFKYYWTSYTVHIKKKKSTTVHGFLSVCLSHLVPWNSLTSCWRQVWISFICDMFTVRETMVPMWFKHSISTGQSVLMLFTELAFKVYNGHLYCYTAWLHICASAGSQCVHVWLRDTWLSV